MSVELFTCEPCGLMFPDEAMHLSHVPGCNRPFCDCDLITCPDCCSTCHPAAISYAVDDRGNAIAMHAPEPATNGQATIVSVEPLRHAVHIVALRIDVRTAIAILGGTPPDEPVWRDVPMHPTFAIPGAGERFSINVDGETLLGCVFGIVIAEGLLGEATATDHS